jgi:uncharacterized protein YcnI
MRIRKIIGAAAAAGGLIVMMAAPVLAHVTVKPDSAAKGGFATLTFQVPNETDDTNTVKIDLKLPDDHPFASVSVQPKAGWTYQTTPKSLPTPVTNDDGQQVTQFTSEIAWTGGQIKPGEFDTFQISVGALPDDADSLTFPVIQSYDNGQDVSWIDPTVEGQPEPEHPAPVLHLTAAESDAGSSDASSSSASQVSSSDPTVTATVVKKETNNTLGIIALIVGALGLIFGAVALTRSRGGRGAQT